MKILLLTTLVALTSADVSHLLNNHHHHEQGYQYHNPSSENSPASSYGVPQYSVLGNSGGVAQSVSYSSSGSASGPQLTLPSPSVSSVQFNSGFSGPSISGATIQTYENGGFSTPVPLPSGALEGLRVSTPAPSVDFSNIQVSTPSAPSVNLVQYQQPANSYQFLQKLSQPSQSTLDFNSVRIGSDAAINSGFAQSSFTSDSQLNSGLGLGVSHVGSSIENLNDAQLNSGLGLGGSQFVSKTSGGSIADAFGVSSDSADSVSISAQQNHLEPEVSKNLYFFAAPEEEEEEVEARINVPQVAPKKTYKIIFIKAPTYRNQATITIPAAPQNEEKTLVYVLVKKPERHANVRFQPAAPTKPSKPEVFFIKYKTQKEAEAAVAEIQSKHGASGQVIANLPAGQTINHAQIQAQLDASPSFGGSSLDSLGANSFTAPGPVSVGFETRSGSDEPEDSVVSQQQNSAPTAAPAVSENVQFNLQSAQITPSVPTPVSSVQQSGSFGAIVSSSDASSDDSASSVVPSSGPVVIGQQSFNYQVFGQNSNTVPSNSNSNVVSGTSNEDSNQNSSASSSEEDHSSSNDSTSSQDAEHQEDSQVSHNNIEERVGGESTVDSEVQGSGPEGFKTYGPPSV